MPERGFSAGAVLEALGFAIAPTRNSFPFFIMIPITMTEKLRRWLHADKEKSPEAAQACE